MGPRCGKKTRGDSWVLCVRACMLYIINELGCKETRRRETKCLCRYRSLILVIEKIQPNSFEGKFVERE